MLEANHLLCHRLNETELPAYIPKLKTIICVKGSSSVIINDVRSRAVIAVLWFIGFCFAGGRCLCVRSAGARLAPRWEGKVTRRPFAG